MIVAALMLQAVAPSAQSQDPDVVVVARNVEGAKQVLDACIARRCPPDQEIKAALVYATRQFLAGDYAASRKTLLTSRHRNATFDKTYPVEVSDLHRALTTLSNLDGRPDGARISSLNATDALRAGLSPDDPLILVQRLDTARQLAREGRIIGATQIINDVAGKANKKRYYGVEAQALFQGAGLYAALANFNSDYRGAAKQWRNRIAQRREAEFTEYRDALSLLDAQIAAMAAKKGARQQVLTDVRPVGGGAAILLDEPVVHFAASENGRKGFDGGNTEPEWADVAFWVRPDGSVAAVKVIGRSKSPPGSWLERKLTAVAGRRYAPLKRPANDPGLYRVERYSMVYSLGTSRGSRIPTRSGEGQLETTDVTSAHQVPADG